MDIEPDEGMLTLSRKLTEGRSVCRINGETVNMSILKEAASLLIDIHGQHDSQSLLQRRNHLSLLDLFGKEEIYPLKEEMAAAYKKYQELVKKRDASSMDAESRARELDLARYEVTEIEEAAPLPGGGYRSGRTVSQDGTEPESDRGSGRVLPVYRRRLSGQCQ